MTSLVLRPPAKINLALSIGPRRPDGFHDVRTVMQSIGLSDRLRLVLERGPFRMTVRPAVVPADRTNLVWRAASLLWRALGRRGEPDGVRVTLDKSIPAEAGLGGGSADAAAALAGLNTLWRGRLPRRDLLDLAAELGSDVPFFLVGGTALALGRGEDVFPLADAQRLGLVLVKPSAGVSTVEAYRWLDVDRARRVGPPAATDANTLALGWATDPFPVTNDLQAPVTRRHPDVLAALRAVEAAGARAAVMSGSGSTVFGVFSESAAPRAARKLTRTGWDVIPTTTLSRREALRRMSLC
jgi:4-diphosphocytidyl-2-C-methyl-D-erythritol kinase